jgi:FixJ family two-component response regulator
MKPAGNVVYMVDDDPRVREGLENLFDSVDIAVLTFSSAADYLEHSRVDDAACLILDLQMPGIGGLELQGRLAQEGSPPIIFITGRGDIPSTVKAMKAGAIEFLTKPVDTETLLAAVSTAFARDRLLRDQRAVLSELEKKFALLSPREREVLPLVVKGLLNKQAAAVLGIKEVTLQIHRSQIMQKMAAGSLAELVRMASRLSIPADANHTKPL